MKMQSLYDLLEAAQDVCSLFNDVETPAQLVSRLERLKRLDVESALEDLEALRAATANMLEEHLELGGALGEDDPEDAIAEFLNGVEGEPKAEPGDEVASPDTKEGEAVLSQENADTPSQ